MDLSTVAHTIANRKMAVYKNGAIASLSSFLAFANSHSKEDLVRLRAQNSVQYYNPKSKSIATTGVRGIERAAFGSVGIIPVYGVMMRDDYCDAALNTVRGTRSLEQDLIALENSDRVDSVVIRLNSPGGEALGNESLANVIKSMSKPVYVSFEMMASAAVASFINADGIYAVENSAIFGSIGTMVTIQDPSRFFEEMGIDMRDIYAPQSDLKNIEYRAALEGDDSPMLERLETMTSFFINNVKKARPNINDDGRIFRGQIYDAKQARKMRAIDGVQSLSKTLDQAAKAGRKYRRDRKNGNNSGSSSNSQQQSDINIMAEDKLSEGQEKQVEGLFAKWFGTSSKQKLSDVSAELEGANAKVVALNQEIETFKASNKALAEKNASTEQNLAAANDRIAELEKQNADLAKQVQAHQEDLSNLEKLDLAQGEQKIETVQALVERSNKVFAHNRELGATPDTEVPSSTEEEDVTVDQSWKQDSKIDPFKQAQELMKGTENKK